MQALLWMVLIDRRNRKSNLWGINSGGIWQKNKSEINEYGDDEFNPWVIGATM